jgi:hypothetical protein
MSLVISFKPDGSAAMSVELKHTKHADYSPIEHYTTTTSFDISIQLRHQPAFDYLPIQDQAYTAIIAFVTTFVK